PDDLPATAVAAVAARIAEVLGDEPADEIVLAGGGVRNAALVGALAASTAPPVVLADAAGVPADGREAAAMAVLGALCADGVPVTLPSVTGCRAPAPLAGSWCGTRPA
ncbi:MAG: anhydro-N-acetylmuramic acid kinase, partial [Planctomycetota bacterium]